VPPTHGSRPQVVSIKPMERDLSILSKKLDIKVSDILLRHKDYIEKKTLSQKRTQSSVWPGGKNHPI
jgi:hypothetical protein